MTAEPKTDISMAHLKRLRTAGRWKEIIDALDGAVAEGQELNEALVLFRSNAYRKRRDYDGADAALAPWVENGSLDILMESGAIAMARGDAAAAVERWRLVMRRFGTKAPPQCFENVLAACRQCGGFDAEIADFVVAKINTMPYAASDVWGRKFDLVIRYAYRAIGSGDLDFIRTARAQIDDAVANTGHLQRTDNIRNDRLHRVTSMLTARWHADLMLQDYEAFVGTLLRIVSCVENERLEQVAFQASYNPIRACVLLGYLGIVNRRSDIALRGLSVAADLLRQAGADMRFHFVMLGEFGRSVQLMQFAAGLYAHVDPAAERPRQLGNRPPSREADEAVHQHCFREEADRLFELVVSAYRDIGAALPPEAPKLS